MSHIAKTPTQDTALAQVGELGNSVMEVNVSIDNMTQEHLKAVVPNGKKLAYIYAEGEHGRVLLSKYNCGPCMCCINAKLSLSE